MKLIILVTLALAAVAVAAPSAPEPPKILRSDYEQQPEGSYAFNVETEDKINREETGVLKEVLDEDKKPHLVITVRGSYSYVDSEGKPVFVTYFADENGYHAEGDIIPKPVRR